MHRWADLGTAADRAARERFEGEVELSWMRWVEGGARARDFGQGVWVERHDPHWVVRWQEPSCRPFAETVLRRAPSAAPVVLGLQSLGWEQAAAWVERTHGVNLATSQVRVGITRGHLLAIVVSVPLDVAGSPELLQVAAENLCEHTLGEQLLDRWVVSVDVVRSARRSRLAVLADDAAGAAEMHPGSLLGQLVDLGIDAVRANVPESQLATGVGDWTALELSPSAADLQADRLQAFTDVPEALKAALEGLPFDSARFTRGPEVMIWLAWSSGPLAERIALREAVETTLGEPAANGRWRLCGSGFGKARDYLDLWVLPEVEVIRELRARVEGRLERAALVGFYDSHWARELS